MKQINKPKSKTKQPPKVKKIPSTNQQQQQQQNKQKSKNYSPVVVVLAIFGRIIHAEQESLICGLWATCIPLGPSSNSPWYQLEKND